MHLTATCAPLLGPDLMTVADRTFENAPSPITFPSWYVEWNAIKRGAGGLGAGRDGVQ